MIRTRSSSSLSRRAFVQHAGLLLSAATPGLSAIRPQIGVQLYTVRNLLEAQPLLTVQSIARIGYRYVEIMRSQVKVIAPLLKEVGLKAVSLHFETPLITGNYVAWQHADMPPLDPGITFEDTLSLARDNGMKYIVFNYLAPEERLGLDFYRRLAGKLNGAAAKAQAAGLQFCYHNHDFEFQPKPGGRPIDVLLSDLDPRLIRLEVDAFWVSMAGVNASEFLRRNARRVSMVHLKDRAPGTPLHYDIATVPETAYRELGSGDLPLPEILNSIRQSAAEYVFVEQDFSPDPLASLRQSYAFLQKHGFA
jgi:sugar phosphate isomerase/epimerase